MHHRIIVFGLNEFHLYSIIFIDCTFTHLALEVDVAITISQLDVFIMSSREPNKIKDIQACDNGLVAHLNIKDPL